MLSSFDFAAKCKQIRRDVLEMVYRAKKGHLGGCFSCVEILVSLYYDEFFTVDPRNPRWPGRDIFILSKGHAAPALYAVLADKGFFPREELKTFGEPSSRLCGHPWREIPGVDVTTGSLGHGLGVGVGLAYAMQLDRESGEEVLRRARQKVVVLLGDGDLQEGSTWEAARVAQELRLDNLIVLCDLNKFTATQVAQGPTNLFVGGGWQWNVSVLIPGVREIGNSLREVEARMADRRYPGVVFVDTMKGSGVSFMVQHPGDWHHRIPTEEEYKRAMEELQ